MIDIITGIILAAGSSKRMGKQKLILPLKNSTIVENAVETVKSCKAFGEILVVYQSEEVMDRIKKYDVKTVYNAKAKDGQSTSVIEGIKNSDPDAKAYMFIAGDQPFITKDIIEALINAWKKNQNSIIVPCYDGKKGMPTIFPAEFRQELMNITGDTGGRTIIQGNSDRVMFVDFYDTMAGFDIDTPEEYNETLKII
ncbi:molybdenum cofactor cytidylyltransferase [Lutispora saccharofermentans]|mgnify:FL=1|uniref:Molybdenum cofactor cytidylyltransferase n=1 Tax=Lutispora saccharofermentans TaxID=3024236 RepID=A0ABT1NA80_9FIRM|nr:molybdenum cofactor cytidylyltransferase [Lutispora saccharofermentans]